MTGAQGTSRVRRRQRPEDQVPAIGRAGDPAAGIPAVLPRRRTLVRRRGDSVAAATCRPRRLRAERLRPAHLARPPRDGLFGFAAAALAGFLLTAVPQLDGRLPLRGSRLAVGLVPRLWLAGRLAVATRPGSARSRSPDRRRVPGRARRPVLARQIADAEVAQPAGDGDPASPANNLLVHARSRSALTADCAALVPTPSIRRSWSC